MKFAKKRKKEVETIRLNKIEQDTISKKALEINRIRALNGLEPITKSDLVHILIGASLSRIKSTEYGEVLID